MIATSATTGADAAVRFFCGSASNRGIRSTLKHVINGTGTMSETSDKTAARRDPAAKPYPSWPDLLAKVGRGRSDYRNVEAPAAREWRDVVADMIVGRR